MIIKRVLSAFAAAAAVLTFSAGTVFADDAKDEKPVIKFEADGTMLSADNVPAISFDTEKYEDYIHLTRDADKAGIKLAQDKDTYYQGASMKVSASTDGVDGYFNCSGMARDDDNNLLFPDAPETEVTVWLIIPPVQLSAVHSFRPLFIIYFTTLFVTMSILSVTTLSPSANFIVIITPFSYILHIKNRLFLSILLIRRFSKTNANSKFCKQMLHFCYRIADFSLLKSPFNTLLGAKKSPENSGLFGIFRHGKSQYSGTKKRTIKLQAVTVLTRL